MPGIFRRCGCLRCKAGGVEDLGKSRAAVMSDPIPPGGKELRAKTSAAQIAEILRRHRRFLDKQKGGMRAMLHFHDLSGQELSDCDLSDSDLTGTSFSHARLPGASFRRANLFCADLRMANLTRADFTNADLRGVCLRGAELSDAVLVSADIRTAAMARYDTAGEPQFVDFDETPAQLAAIVAKRANFTGAKLSGSFVLQADLTGANLRNADLRGTDLRNSVLVGTSMNGADLSGAQLNGASFAGADLTGARISGADFAEADLCGAVLDPEAMDREELKKAIRSRQLKLDGPALAELLNNHKVWLDSLSKTGVRANFAETDMSGQTFSGLDLTIAQMARCALRNSNLSNSTFALADLGFSDLRGADFSHADMRGINLENATLTGANLFSVKLDPMIHVGMQQRDTCSNLSRARLVGVNLRDADLRKAILAGADLSAANLCNANLSEADLTATNLAGATLTGANFAGAKLAKIIGLDAATLARIQGPPA